MTAPPLWILLSPIIRFFFGFVNGFWEKIHGNCKKMQMFSVWLRGWQGDWMVVMVDVDTPL